MSVKLLTEHHLEFISIKGGCTGSSVSTPLNMLHCWKSHVADLLGMSKISVVRVLLASLAKNNKEHA